jgi:hypothetical protein
MYNKLSGDIGKVIWQLKQLLLKRTEYVGFQVLAEAGIKLRIFWDILPCS